MNPDEELKEFESAANRAAIARQHEMEMAREGWLKETERVKELEKELADSNRRIKNQKSFIQGFASCLDGLPINHIGGSLIDGTRDAGSIRTIVGALLKQLAEAQAVSDGLSKSVTALALAIDPSARCGPETKNLIEHANKIRSERDNALAAGAELRRKAIHCFVSARTNDRTEKGHYLVEANVMLNLQQAALSSTCGQSLLDERDRLRKALELVISAATCEHCGKPATCVGRYEDPSGPIQFACDECCGHGNEDGWCKRLEALKGQP